MKKTRTPCNRLNPSEIIHQLELGKPHQYKIVGLTFSLYSRWIFVEKCSQNFQKPWYSHNDEKFQIHQKSGKIEIPHNHKIVKAFNFILPILTWLCQLYNGASFVHSYHSSASGGFHVLLDCNESLKRNFEFRKYVQMIRVPRKQIFNFTKSFWSSD